MPSFASPSVVVGVESAWVASDYFDWRDPERSDVGAVDVWRIRGDAAA